MNPVFIIIIAIAAGLLWLLSSFLYRPIGTIGKRLYNDAKRAIFEKDDNNKNKKN